MQPSVYSEEFIQYVRNSNSDNNTLSRTVWHRDDEYTKIYIGKNIVQQRNRNYFQERWNNLSSGIDDVVNKLNTVDAGIIQDYVYRDNYYLETVSPAINPVYRLHRQPLIDRVGGIHNYIRYFIDTVGARAEKLQPYTYDDYNHENIMVDQKLEFTCIDFDDVFISSVNKCPKSVWDKIKSKMMSDWYINQTYHNTNIVDTWDEYLYSVYGDIPRQHDTQWDK